MRSTKFYIGETMPEQVAGFLVREFPEIQGATLIPAVGLWEGIQETVTILEIVGPFPRSLADRLRKEYRQDAILVQETPIFWSLNYAKP